MSATNFDGICLSNRININLFRKKIDNHDVNTRTRNKKERYKNSGLTYVSLTGCSSAITEAWISDSMPLAGAGCRYVLQLVFEAAVN